MQAIFLVLALQEKSVQSKKQKDSTQGSTHFLGSCAWDAETPIACVSVTLL